MRETSRGNFQKILEFIIVKTVVGITYPQKADQNILHCQKKNLDNNEVIA